MKYHHHSDVKCEYLKDRPTLTTKFNGMVAVDSVMQSLWETANGRSLDQILTDFQVKGSPPLATAAGIGCLVEAGLLEREPCIDFALSEKHVPTGDNESVPLISAVIVAYNGRDWLGPCLDSLLAQSYSKLELIVVDNSSKDGTVDWLREFYPAVEIIVIPETVSFARAANQGCAGAQGEYYLVLNQDIWLDPSCVAEMAATFRNPQIAACAPSLYFMWAPSFLNGIGNQFRSLGWGTDNAIGHLDLGQFATWNEVPSVCFAATLISSRAWKEIGPLDEGFTMYYEDSEWSYRARLCGYRLGAAPNAHVYHAFGGRRAPLPKPLSTTKLSNVVYGRLYFVAKLFSASRKILGLVSFLLQDIIGLVISLFTLKFDRIRSIFVGWQKFLTHPPKKYFGDSHKQKEVFARDDKVPRPHIWKELPELTWEMVCCEYLPLILSGQTRPVPEITEVLGRGGSLTSTSFPSRLQAVWQGGGGKSILRKIWQDIRWQLS